MEQWIKSFVSYVFSIITYIDLLELLLVSWIFTTLLPTGKKLSVADANAIHLLRLPFEITQFLLFSSVLTKLEAF
jgi:hypothetical protein